ncbi:MAG: helix-turn-helix domain-containing protein [Bacilli bacterium]
MKILKAFRFRLEPTDEQARKFSRYQGCMRFVWNKALALQKGRLEAGYPLLSYGELARLLTLWRRSSRPSRKKSERGRSSLPGFEADQARSDEERPRWSKRLPKGVCAQYRLGQVSPVAHH